MKSFQDKLRFNWTYFSVSVLLFLLEFIIERWAHDGFVRPYVGDFFIVILLYSLVKSFWNGKPVQTALVVLAYSYILEFTQYLKLSQYLGVDKSWIGRLILGNYFAWGDLLAYTLGIGVVIAFETLLERWRKQTR